MTDEPHPFQQDHLPTADHRAALDHVLAELDSIDHQLLVTGSVAQRTAARTSDIDLIVIVKNSESCGGMASLAIGFVVDAAEQHEIVSVARYLYRVKVSLRILQWETLEALVAGEPELSIWKTHAVSHKRRTPERLIGELGQIIEKPFEERRSKGGYAYPMRIRNEDGQRLLNVEMTMLLTAKVVRSRGIDREAPSHVAEAVLSGSMAERFEVLNALATSGYLDPARSDYLAGRES